VFYLDAYWQTFGRWSDLRWDDKNFPGPAALLAEVAATGTRPCLWINPYIGVESPVFAMAEDAGYFLKRADGSTYVGTLWGSYHPAVAVIDLTGPGARAWWGTQLAKLIGQGAAVFRTDFGEEIPTDIIARNGMTGERLHNAYCLIYNDLVTSVMRGAGIEHPVLWARSTWAGGQRHVGQWGGDPNSSWQDLASTLRAGLSMALSGHAFWSHDIGGFHGQPDGELYVRWAQFGMLSPLSRFHGTTTRVPWDYGPDALAWVRAVTRLRYVLHPYLYAAAAESVRRAAPIMRPMVYDFPQDPCAQAADLQYLLGHDMLVAPLYRPGGRRLVWFPPGEWVHYADGSRVRGPGYEEVALPLEHAPLWVRAGSTILLAGPRRRIGEGRYDHLALVAAVDQVGGEDLHGVAGQGVGV
jgi:alpha-D-xyloside xylohydrolase